MKNNSNIYDIDGELIRGIDDTHKWTVEEAHEKIEYYRKKIEEIGENDEKSRIYATYIRNLSKYILDLYLKMTPDELTNELNRQNAKEDVKNQVKKAIDELKKEIEEENSETGEPNDSESEDKLVEERKETVMDEYVPFEEVQATQEEQ
jgi:hypothetical protein